MVKMDQCMNTERTELFYLQDKRLRLFVGNYLMFWAKDGKGYTSEEYERWINIQLNGLAYPYTTSSEAKIARGRTCIACVHVRFKEGDGL